MTNFNSCKKMIELIIETRTDNSGGEIWELRSSSGILIRQFTNFFHVSNYLNGIPTDTLVVIYVTTDAANKIDSKENSDFVTLSEKVVFIDFMGVHRNMSECIIVESGEVKLEINGISLHIGTWNALEQVKDWLSMRGGIDLEVRFILNGLRTHPLTKEDAMRIIDMIDDKSLVTISDSNKSEEGKDDK